MKVFVLRNMEDEVIGVSEEKLAILLYMAQNNLREEDYTIEKVKGEEGNDMFSKYADTRDIVFVSKRDIVAMGRHADAIFESLSDMRFTITNTINSLVKIKELNVSKSESDMLNGTINFLKKLLEDNEALEDLMKDTIIFYLSKSSIPVVKEDSFLRGKDYY